MKASGWIVPAASGALFAAAIVVALGLASPNATPVALENGTEPAQRAAEPLRIEPVPKETTTTTTAQGPMEPTNAKEMSQAAPLEEAAAPESAVPDDVPMVITGDVAVAHSVADGCQRKQVEWVRREDAGEIDWDRMFPNDEVDDPESVWLEPRPFDGGVQTGDERIVLPDFSRGLAVDTLSNRALLSAVEVCDDAGFLED